MQSRYRRSEMSRPMNLMNPFHSFHISSTSKLQSGHSLTLFRSPTSSFGIPAGTISISVLPVDAQGFAVHVIHETFFRESAKKRGVSMSIN
jgi:hypothetical protein